MKMSGGKFKSIFNVLRDGKPVYAHESLKVPAVVMVLYDGHPSPQPETVAKALAKAKKEYGPNVTVRYDYDSLWSKGDFVYRMEHEQRPDQPIPRPMMGFILTLTGTRLHSLGENLYGIRFDKAVWTFQWNSASERFTFKGVR